MQHGTTLIIYNAITQRQCQKLNQAQSFFLPQTIITLKRVLII